MPVDRQSLVKRLAEFVSEHGGKSYEDSLIPLIRAQFKSNDDEDLSKLFCSELVAACYKHLGFLSSEKVAGNFTPKDFSNDALLLHNADLGPIIKYSLRHALADHDMSDIDDRKRLTNSAPSSAPPSSAPRSPRMRLRVQVAAQQVAPSTPPKDSWRRSSGGSGSAPIAVTVSRTKDRESAAASPSKRTSERTVMLQRRISVTELDEDD